METDEAERTPNRYAAHALLLVPLTLLLAGLLNEVGVFEVDRALIWDCFALSAVSCAVVWCLSRSEKYSADPRSKYFILAITLFLTLSVTVFLNINAVLLLIFPMLLTTQYRSMGVTWMAVIGSCVCCLLSPILAWFCGTWGLNFMTGFLETVCRVSVEKIGPAVISPRQAVFNLLIYHCLPQLMTLWVFAFIFLTITRNNIRGMKARLQVMKLSEDLNQELNRVVSMQDQILYGIAGLVESRDATTGGHVKRSSEIVRILLDAMRRDESLHLSEEYCAAVVKAAPLHDLGKISVDDAILRKPGRLNEEETAAIRQHPVKSAEIIHSVLHGIESEEFLCVAENLARYHHERYDGSGFPEGLRGEEIPLEARIMAVADVYDALVSRRSYKEPLTLEESFRAVVALMGSQFDPGLEKYFVQARPQIEKFYSE